MSKPNILDAIRERHHSAARLIASGRSISDVAHLLGSSETQLTRQCQDPTFRDLISRYRNVDAELSAGLRFRSYALAA